MARLFEARNASTRRWHHLPWLLCVLLGVAGGDELPLEEVVATDALPGAEAVVTEGEVETAEPRELQGSAYITTASDMPLPDNHVLYMAEGSVQSWTCSSFCTAIEGAHAGANYTKVQLQIPGGSFSFSDLVHNAARLKVVDNTLSEPMALVGECGAGKALVAASSQLHHYWGSNTGSETTPISRDILQADDYLKFKMGGNYRLCYSANGTFGEGQADITRQRIEVNGIYDRSPGCVTENCLTHRRYECYMRKEGFSTSDGEYGLKTSCVIDYSYGGAGFYGPVGQGTWSAEFAATYDEKTGALRSLQESPCTSTPAAFICKDGGACQAGDAFITPDASVQSKRINIPSVREDLVGNEYGSTLTYSARTVAACYCPARSGCSDKASFIQQVGIIYFYLSKVCHAGTNECLEDFNGVTGQYRFRIRVECTTDSCQANEQSRIKLVGKIAQNDLPSWDTGNGCRTGVHGVVRGLQVLPPTTYQPIDGSDAGILNEPNCKKSAGALGCTLSGGSRQDYKTFGGAYGFRFSLGFTDHEARGFHTSKDVDTCYCNSLCDDAANWFKVGSLRLGPTRLVSSATSRSSLPAQWTVEFVNQPGIIGLYRPYSDAGVLGLQENSLLKLVTDQDKTFGDDECALSGYNSQFTMGLSNEVAASMNYLGKRQTQTPPDLQKIVFNSNSFVNTITVTSAGTLAVCYCAVSVDNRCQDDSNWKLVTHLTIKGPKLNQRWSFSTNVVFRFSYEGYGISSGDQIRIISSDGKCTDDNYNPNSAAIAYTALKVKCPVPCNDVTLNTGSEPGDLPTMPLSSSSYRCDIFNENCQDNDITGVEVLSETETLLTFQQYHGMLTGDEVTLGNNIFCQPNDPVCTPEMLSALKGVFEFADLDTKNPAAPESYMATHKLTETSNRKKAIIKIGWPGPVPKFTIIYAGARPEIGYIGRGGQWVHRSRAISREEVMAEDERANLRVCWKFGGNGGKYVEEIGKMTIRNPATMIGATLSMSTASRRVRAPMILTFSTAAGVTGLRYEQATDSLRLKIVFTKTDLVDIVYSDPEGTDIPYSVTTEDDVVEASQTICGKLFLEMWSADMERGFPMPKGCYYKSYPGGFRREIFLLFEGKSGLRKGTTYQLVFNGVVREDSKSGLFDLVQKNGQFLELFPMDDVTARPYEAIERGVVTLTTAPKYPTSDRAHPQFAEGGFKIIGGYQNLLEMEAGSSITAEIMGHPTTGKILGSQILRIFLWPLTQWQTTSSCTAECVENAEVSFNCGVIDSCLGQAAVPGRGLNILKITLPPCETPTNCQWDELYGNRKVQIRVGGITIPSGGFFAQRLAAEISDEGDSFPNYTLTSGNYIWKAPNEGITAAKVVSQAGGGNLQPFRGDKMNVLYARFTLSSTIKARDDTGEDASFTITLPEGYRCLDMSYKADPPGDNTWAAEANLLAFGSYVPQGRGTLSDGTATHGWEASGRTCTYRPMHPGGIVYAGSSIVAKITVDNPTISLQRADDANVWTVHYANKGMHEFSGLSIRQVTPKYRFSSPPDPFYQTNNAVFGVITDASCQPQILSASTKKAVNQELHFFFRTQQEVGAGGLVRLHAPAGFNFGQPCNASNLPAPYYATDADPADATLPLPGIMACVTRGPVLGIAELRLERILLGGRVFGFKIRVQNPEGYDPASVTGWQLFTADARDYTVDGTPETIPFTEQDDTSWGIYSSANLGVSVKISDLRPYAMTGKRAYVSLVLEKVPTGNSGYIRFRAPEGYVWSFDDSEFIYQLVANTPVAFRPMVPPGITKEWPSGLPLKRDGSNTLIFAPGNFVLGEVYGFAGTVEVPTKAPTASTNAFFLELGYNSSTTSERLGGATIQAPPVRALKNAQVDYATTILGKENLIQFRVETITHIPEGGGIEITVPEGFSIDRNCELLPVRDPSSPLPPETLSCEAYFDAQLGLTGKIILRLTAGPGGLRADYHAFAVLAENPKETMLNYPMGGGGALGCGTYICWTFNTYQYIANITNPSSNILDYSTSAQGFDITRKMLEARIPTLTEEQRISTGRDDRPLQNNSVIFAVKLSQTSSTSGQMIVRAPYGFTFHEECLQYLVVSEGATFGPKIRFPEAFTVWPTAVVIQNCRGSGRVAILELVYGLGARLLTNELYIFRMGIQTNPLTTPAVNRWTIQLGGEASEPIEGMTLWAFTETSVTPITTARDRTLAGAERTQNPLKIRIRPFNTITTDGEIRAVAPEGFQFVHQPSKVCLTELEELPYTALGIKYPGYVYTSLELVCLVDASDSKLVSVKIRSPRPVSAGIDYLLVLSVYNPKEILDFGPTIWRVSSFTASRQSLDQSQITGFRMNEVMNLWSYSNPDPGDPSMEVRNGGARLPEFSLKLRNPTILEFGDEIHIVSPQDFILTDAQGNCRGFRWIDPDADFAAPSFSPLPNSYIECNSSTIKLTIMEPTPVDKDYHIEFGLDLFNPLRTPILTDNFWRCVVLSTNVDTSGNKIIKSSKAFQSWDIVPQLEDLQVTLLGPNTAAGSVSSISVEFTPVTSAEDIAIQFNDPSGFNFNNAVTEDKEKQVIFLANGELVRVRMDIRRGERKQIILRNVILGKGGGQTVISLTTWKGGLFQGGTWVPGAKQDERLNYREGFRLPGKVSILYDKLENTYQLDPLTYPEQALWRSQMGRPAYAEFHFQLSIPAEVGHFLKISAKPYEPTYAKFLLVESPVGQATNSNAPIVKRAIANEITTMFGGEIHTRLLEPLVPFRRYEVYVSIIAPSAYAAEAHGGPIKWFLETRDFGQLPTNTNDGVSREFPIVEEYDFFVEAARSPPLADIAVSLTITPALKAPTSLRLVAPLNFNFSENCLVEMSDYVTDCQPGKPTPNGRATANLAVRGAPAVGIEGTASGIMIRVSTPTRTPINKEWFVEGRDMMSDQQMGWGQAAGVEVLPMQDSSATYPGISGVRGRIVWRFRTQLLVQAGAYLDVRLPDGFKPECDDNTLKAIALPVSSGACNIMSDRQVIVFLNTTMVPREYVFGFFVTPPASSPLFNELSIILRDRFGQVSDAAVEIPGAKILDKLRIRETSMQYTSTRPERESTITIGFEVLESLPDLVVAPDQQINEVLITLPYGFTHLVEKATDFQLMNEDMPLRQGDFLDYFQKDRIRIYMELNRSSWVTLKSGVYSFRFNVMVPSPLPTFNVWHVSLCSPNYPEGCNRITDPAVMVTFPMPGFELNSEANGMTLTASAGRAPPGKVVLLSILLTLVGYAWREG